MKMYVAGEWTAGGAESTISSPWSGEPIDAVPRAIAEQVERAFHAAFEGASAMRELTAYERTDALNRAPEPLAARGRGVCRDDLPARKASHQASRAAGLGAVLTCRG